MPAPAGASCRPRAGPDDPCGPVAETAVAAVATVNAPAVARTMALDRLNLVFRCRDKGIFRWFACHAICFTLDCLRRPAAAGICAWDVARVRAPADSRSPSHGGVLSAIYDAGRQYVR